MSELRETDPRLAAVRVKKTGRNLLDPSNPNPLGIDMKSGRSVRFSLCVENTLHGMMDLSIESDEDWLEPETKQITLVGGEQGEVVIVANPVGQAEFANLIFTWPGIEETLSTSVMVMRKISTNRQSQPSQNSQQRQTRQRQPMPVQAGTYCAEINRDNPTAFLFLVDQSASMVKPIGGESGKKKAIFLSDQLNLLLYELVGRCSKGVNIRDYFHIGVIGYGHNRVGSAFKGALEGRELTPISELAEHPLKVETRTVRQMDSSGRWTDVSVNLPLWYQPAANGKTPMCKALAMAHEYIESFLVKYPDCRPPVVINISDGAATDGDPRPTAGSLLSLKSTDGNVLLFNLHVSSKTGQPVQFPVSESVLSDPLAKLLFQISSPIPEPMLQLARSSMPGIADGARGFVFNADMATTVQMLDIGTRAK